MVNIDIETDDVSEQIVFAMEVFETGDDGGTVTQSVDGTELKFEPNVVPQITYENSGNMEQTTDNCGRTETSRRGDTNWDITVESDFGTRDEMRRLMRFTRANNPPVVTTDLYTGIAAEVSDIQITQGVNRNVGFIRENAETQFNVEETIDRDKVRLYSYQIQLKQPQDEGLF